MPDLLSASEIAQLIARVKAREITVRGRKVIQATVESFGANTMDALLIGQSFNFRDPEVKRFLDKWGAKRVTQINAATRNKLRKLLVDSIERGDGVQKIRRRIEAAFKSMRQGRAITIARTEVNLASNFGSFQALRQAEVPAKEWLTTQDDVTRDTHRAMDGQVRSTSDAFQSPSGARAMYPGGFGKAEEDVNCRCSVLASFKKVRRFAGMSRVAVWRVWESQKKPFDRRLTAALRAAFAAQRDAVLAAFDNLTSQADDAANAA